MNRRTLSIVLLGDAPFETLVDQLAIAFQTSFQIENKKGRRIADARIDDASLAVVDREDDLGDFLSDEHVVLNVAIESDAAFTPAFEERIQRTLQAAGLAWDRGVWSRLSRDEPTRIIRPA